MKYLKSYKIFETIQQAEKITKQSGYNTMHWGDIKDAIIKNGLQNYLGYLAENGWMLEDFNVEDIVNIIKFAKSNKINIDDKKIYKLNEIYYDYKKLKPYKDFIKKWCPSSIRNESDPEMLYSKLRRITSFYEKLLYTIPADRVESLKKSSSCKTFEEWCNVVKELFTESFDIKKLKDDEDVNIFYENNKYILFESTTYESYMKNIISPNWCLRSEDMFDNYKRTGHRFIIYLDKGDIKKSLIFTITKSNAIFMTNNYVNNSIKDVDFEIESKVKEIIQR